MARKILIVGTGSLRNYGCEAIVQGTCRIIAESGMDAEVYVASDDPAYDAGMLPRGVRLVSYKRRFTPYRLWRGLLRRVFHIGNGSPVRMDVNIGKRYDIVLSCGGDNYCETPDGTLYTLLTDLMAIGENAVRAGRKYVLWGASVGPFNEENERLVFRNLGLCSLITVREKLAFDYLGKASLGERLRLVADPAFAMAPDNDVDLPDSWGGVCIGLNFSELSIYHTMPGGEVGDFVRKLWGTLDAALEEHPGWSYVCVPHVVVDDGAQNDRRFLEKYLAATRFPDRVAMLPEGLGARKTKGCVAKLDLLVAARMHCCVAGVSVGTPTLFVTYSNKGKGMSYYAYGNHDWETAVPDLVEVSFLSKLEEMVTRRDEIRGQLDGRRKTFLADALRAGEYLRIL